MKGNRGVCSLVVLLVLLCPRGPLARAANDDWLPISPEELALKDDPLNPGAHAIILYREVFSDHEESFESSYYRIKILTEEGKKYANVEIPYAKGLVRVKELEARTVRGDGTVVPFRGEVFEKTVVKTRRIKLLAKTFSLPEVEVGSIVEYRFKLRWDRDRLLSPAWVIQGKLSLRRGRFRVKPTWRAQGVLGWTYFWVPENKKLEAQEDGTYLLEVENVPSFREEEYMPPADELKMRVGFFYSKHAGLGSEGFWREVGEERYKAEEKFIAKRKAMKRAVAEIISPDDPPETQLRKIYARVHGMRNLSYERSRTRKEEKREKLKENKNVEDVWRRGYGKAWDLNRLFVGLARAAGFEASVVLLSARTRGFFHEQVLDASQLNAHVVLVRWGEKELYLDPATPYCPFGYLSWEQTAVRGLRLDKEGGEFVSSPLPRSADAVTGRRARLRLDADGSLAGRVEVAFRGEEALRRRLEAMEEDEAGRQEKLEEEIKGWFSAGAQVEIESESGWESAGEPLRVEFRVEVPEFAIATGRRLLLPLGVFQVNRTYPFAHAERVHPVYFLYPWQEVDEITLELPPGYEVEGMPPGEEMLIPFGKYEISCEKQAEGLRVRRRLVMEGNFFKKEYYAALRFFYNKVKAGDEQHAVLEAVQVVQAK